MSRKTSKKSPNAFQARNWGLLIVAGLLIAVAIWLIIHAILAFSSVPLESIMVLVVGAAIIFSCIMAIDNNSWKGIIGQFMMIVTGRG